MDKYDALLSQFKEDKVNLDLETVQVKREGLIYLKSEKERFNAVEEIFRSLVKQFYDNTGGTFKIKETSDAKYLFDIEAQIPKDGSQGIGEVKIFCYDLLFYLLNKELLGFIAHDGCLFSEMDPRQKSMIFKVILELVGQYDLQYFVNIGDNSLKEILDKDNTIAILSDEEKARINEAQILKLYDKNPETWLFGESFN